MTVDSPFSAVLLRPLSGTGKSLVATATNNCVGSQMGWINSHYPGTGQITSFGTPNEVNLRPPASLGFAFAVLVGTSSHDPAATGFTDATVLATAIRLIDSFALSHAGNGGSWGGEPATVALAPDATSYQWQGAFWVALAGVGARLIWSQLTSTQQTHVTNMVVSEADRFLTYPVPYQRDFSGRVSYVGDTKAEENAWDAWVLYLAAATNPAHAHAASWLAKALELSLSSLATPAFPTSKYVFNGMSGWGLRGGSNLGLSGALENHLIISPNYSASLAQNWINGLTFGWLRTAVPAATLVNATLVYRSMVDVSYSFPPQLSPGGPVYQPGGASVYYPGGDEGDPNRMANYLAMDALAHCISADATSSVAADTWLSRHAQAQIDMQTVDSNARRSYWDFQHAAWGVLADWIVRTASPGQSNAAAATLVLG